MKRLTKCQWRHVSRRIQHQAAPLEARLVLDLKRRYLPRHILHRLGTLNFRRQKLAQGLNAIEETGCFGRTETTVVAVTFNS